MNNQILVLEHTSPHTYNQLKFY